MNTTKKLICILSTGATLVAAAPVFADPRHDRGYDRYRHSTHYRDYDRRGYRDYGRRHVVVVERPYIVERPVYYYPEPAPAPNPGLGAIIGAAIGSIIDNRQ